MNMPWFPPLACAIGIAGTRAALRELRHGRRDRFLWMMPAMAWAPLACWILSLLVRQD